MRARTTRCGASRSTHRNCVTVLVSMRTRQASKTPAGASTRSVPTTATSTGKTRPADAFTLVYAPS